MENEIKEKVEAKSKFVLTMPMAVVLAGLLIGVGIYASNVQKNKQVVTNPNAQQDQGNLDAMEKITKDDHIRGNPDASVIIVEYSDSGCPFCKVFHNTMKQVMKEHEQAGDVAWVYRHFPIDSLHPNARHEAEAMECANELGGNEAFWKYADKVYELTTNVGLPESELSKIATSIGLDVAKFNTCLASGKYLDRIAANEFDAQNTGGQGTPWSIVVAKNGKKYPLSGAQSASAVNALIKIASQK